MRRTRRMVLLLAAMGAALVLSSAVALAAVLVGTDAAETITGGRYADLITGKGGNDTTHGQAGNDTYYYADGHGSDTVREDKTYKVGKRTLSGGIDSLDFSKITGPVFAAVIPEWGALSNSNNRVDSYSYDSSTGYIYNGRLSLFYTPSGSTTPKMSYIETVAGGPDHSDYGDYILTGGLVNTLKPGPGNNDQLRDYGGYPDPDGTGPYPGLAASSDTFKGFSATSGLDYMRDYGGTADKLDLRPFESSDVYVDRSGNSLVITFNGTSGIYVVNYFTSVTSSTGAVSYPNRIENIIFADGTVTPAQAQSMAEASSETRDERDERAEAAKKLVENAPSEEDLKQRLENPLSLEELNNKK